MKRVDVMKLTCRNRLLSGVLAGLVVTTQTANAGGISAHKAFYEMRLSDRVQNSNIVHVVGRSAFVVERDCDGWVSVEDYMIEFINDTGGSDRILSHFESWEADSGDKFSFDVTEDSTFLGRKDFGGFADMSTKDSGRAFFSLDPEAELKLPQGTYFPVRHLESILDAADSGKTMMVATIFTGGEPDDALMTTSTVVGGWQTAEDAIDLGGLGEDGFWPIQVAYFKPTATTSEPEYEIIFSMQPNGVVRNYVIDYGDFSIAADLTRIEDIEAPVCR